ncbi:MAG: hypothetical protein ACYCYK_04485 [Candidatus Dormibacteria bacterium]
MSSRLGLLGLIGVAIVVAGCGATRGPSPAATATAKPIAGTVSMRCAASSDGGSGVVQSVRQWAAIKRVCSPIGGPSQAQTTYLLFKSVDFLNATTGWAAGETCITGTSSCRGLIEGTTDGGSRWRVEYQGSDLIEKLEFVSPNYGWAIATGPNCEQLAGGSPCDLLTTGNGGSSWSLAYTSHQRLQAITLTSPGIGWAWAASKPFCSSPAGALPSSATPCPGTLIRTTDGGQHWTSVMPTTYPIAALTFLGNQGWAVEAGPPATTGVAAADATAARRLLPLGYPLNIPFTVLASTNNGQQWHPLASINTAAGYSPFLQAQIDFSSASQGALSICDRGSSGMHGSCTLAFLTTTDGGLNWAAPAVEGAPTGSDCGPLTTWSLAPQGTLAAVFTVNLAACDPVNPLAVGSVHTLHTVSVWTLTQPEELDWLSPASGWAIVQEASGGGTALAHTNDGGTTWQQVYPRLTPTRAVDFVSPKFGFGIGDAENSGAVLVTTDAGSNWTVVHNFTGLAIAMSAVSRRRAWVLVQHFSGPQGTKAVVEMTIDGGAAFTTVSTFSAADLPQPTSPVPLGTWPDDQFLGSPLHFLSASTGLIATMTGVMATKNAGLSWNRVYPLPTFRCTAKYCPRLLLGADLSSLGRSWLDLMPPPAGLVTTSDGGTAWRVLAASPQFQAVDFVTTQEGWGWGYGGFLRTVNGGRSWTLYKPPWRQQQSNGQPSVRDIFFLTPNLGWIVRHHGLWMTADGGQQWTPLPA